MSGGLGNQLFIFAAAHAHLTNVDKILLYHNSYKSSRTQSISGLISKCKHRCELRKLSILKKAEFRLTDTLAHRLSINLRRVKDYELISAMPSESRILYHRGFFQNAKLIDMVWKNIEEELLLTIEKLGQNTAIEKTLPEKFQVMHIRRGDYTSNKKTIGLLDLCYFKNQLEGDLPLIITTDEENIDFLEETFNPHLIFNQRSLNDWQTLNLISKGIRIICSNSTLSWWGSYVAKKKNSFVEVLLPNPWFKEQKISEQVDLFYKDAIMRKSVFCE